ncbi:MAG: hypothetical protein R3F56_09505 [Planctomycetota bacterium]
MPKLVVCAATLAAAAFASAQDRMYFTGNGNGPDPIRSANLDGSALQVVLPNLTSPQGIAIDPIGRKMYWTDPPRVQRADLNGANIETLVTLTSGVPRAIAVDASAGRMYWAAGSRIQGANLDGSNVQDLVTGLNAATGIALDNAGRMFWTDVNNDVIQSANLDGTNVQTVLNQDGWGIAIDCAARQMYWTVTSGIRRANLDGSNVQTIVTGLTWSSAITVEGRDGKLYWSDRIAQKVQRSDLDGSNVEDLVTGVDTILGIAIDLPGCNASWDRYGSGWAGTNGIPDLTPAGDPVLGCALTIDLQNSSGTAAAGVLVVGLTPAMLPTPVGGTLLVTPAVTVGVNVPAGGLPIVLPLRASRLLCGTPLYLQAAQADAGATQGLSFTSGLRLVLGY